MPLLLVPSRSFIEVLEKASENPFSVQQKNIAELFSRDIDYSKAHRVRIAGEVTWCDTASFYLQDATGAIRVGKGAEQRVSVGEFLDVAAFVYPNGLGRFASNSVIRSKRSDLGQLKAKGLDFGNDWTTKCNGTLVSVKATLLSRVKRGSQEVFELQQKQRLLTALLTSEKSEVPEIALGSVVQITGVCCDVSPGLPPNLLLRTPGDIVILSNPVWWTWRTTAVLICALLAIASGALLWVHLLRRRLERQQEAQLLFSKRVLERVEEERGRIAANLHDGLGQVLLAIKNHALMAMKADSKEKQDVQTRLKEISGVTSQAIEEVRSITRGLRPYQLDRLGLTQAIRASLTRTSENSAVQFAIRVDDIDNLFDKDSEIHIYRIIQEAVNNIIKHSQATEATVVIKKHESTVSLSIRDNGVGFDIANLASRPHDLGYGLSGIGERAKILGGNFNIISQPGEGSSLSVDVPLRENSL
jgi:signal transduction histidine kinase